MVRAILSVAIVALVAIYSRETAAKTPVNPSIVEPAIAYHTKDIDDGNRSEGRSHHRGRRSPGGDVGPSDGDDSGTHYKSSVTGTPSNRHGDRVGVDGRKKKPTQYSSWQIHSLERTFAKLQSTYIGRELDYASLAFNLGLTESQVRKWFRDRRRRPSRQNIARAAEMEAVLQMLRLSSMLTPPNGATVSSSSGNGIGRSEARSVVPSPLSGGLRYSVTIPSPEAPHSVSTSGYGVRTSGPGIFDFPYQYHHHCPSPVHAHRMLTHRAPASFYSHHRHPWHQHLSRAEAHRMLTHRVQSQPSPPPLSLPNQPPPLPPSPPNQPPSPSASPELNLRVWRPWEK